jgi:hypothetical protein
VPKLGFRLLPVPEFKEGNDSFHTERAEYMRKYRSNPIVKARKKTNGKTQK